MNDQIWKDFFEDTQTKRVLDSSEVWRNYSQTELAREEIRKAKEVEAALDQENQLMADVDAFRKKVADNPALKAYLKRAADAIKQNPEFKDRVDPDFLNGLQLLDLED